MRQQVQQPAPSPARTPLRLHAKADAHSLSNGGANASSKTYYLPDTVEVLFLLLLLLLPLEVESGTVLRELPVMARRPLIPAAHAQQAFKRGASVDSGSCALAASTYKSIYLVSQLFFL